jgi:GNAT superfamily N-acetyltransferase
MNLYTPTLEEALEATQKKLIKTIGTNCTINVYRTLNDQLLQTIIKVDAQKFREELRYKREEILEHSHINGFTLILIECSSQPLGLAYGYDDPQTDGFFLDTLASMAERKGIGHILVTLLLIHSQNRGHNQVTLYTEEKDEKGRPLRRFYEKMGFSYFGTEQYKGDVMKIHLNSEKIQKLYEKYIA